MNRDIAARKVRWKRLGVGIALFGALQLVPLERSNPAVAFDLPAPPPIAKTLRRSCYDCHSHETRWPWYAYVAPASWLVVYDVSEARSKLNFSTWKSYRPDKRDRLLEEVLEETEEQRMPPAYYRLLHPEAGLSPAEREVLRQWVEGAAG
jgi:hypothetical protein